MASDDKLAEGRRLAQRYAELNAEVKRLEDEVIPRLKEERLDLQRRQIPHFFDNVIQTDKIGLPELGVDVVVKPFYHANIKADWPEEQRQAAFDYLEEDLDAGDVIAVTVSVKFKRGEIDDARELEKMIRDSRFGNTHPPKLEMGVPWNTLTAMLREMIESGESVNLEKLGATIGREATIKKRKS